MLNLAAVDGKKALLGHPQKFNISAKFNSFSQKIISSLLTQTLFIFLLSNSTELVFNLLNLTKGILNFLLLNVTLSFCGEISGNIEFLRVSQKCLFTIYSFAYEMLFGLTETAKKRMILLVNMEISRYFEFVSPRSSEHLVLCLTKGGPEIRPLKRAICLLSCSPILISLLFYFSRRCSGQWQRKSRCTKRGNYRHQGDKRGWGSHTNIKSARLTAQS